MRSPLLCMENPEIHRTFSGICGTFLKLFPADPRKCSETRKEDGTITDTDESPVPAEYPDLTPEDTAVYTFRVINTPGYVLPATGGQGTGGYAAAGALLILLAGSILLKRTFRRE